MRELNSVEVADAAIAVGPSYSIGVAIAILAKLSTMDVPIQVTATDDSNGDKLSLTFERTSDSSTRTGSFDDRLAEYPRLYVQRQASVAATFAATFVATVAIGIAKNKIRGAAKKKFLSLRHKIPSKSLKAFVGKHIVEKNVLTEKDMSQFERDLSNEKFGEDARKALQETVIGVSDAMKDSQIRKFVKSVRKKLTGKEIKDSVGETLDTRGLTMVREDKKTCLRSESGKNIKCWDYNPDESEVLEWLHSKG